jgi:hypothetical protein
MRGRTGCRDRRPVIHRSTPIVSKAKYQPEGSPVPDPNASAAVDAVLDRLRADNWDRALVVDSPPGAGKSTLVVAAARTLVRDLGSDTVPVVVQTNNQADDLVRRLGLAGLRAGRLVGSKHQVPPEVLSSGLVAISGRWRDLAAPGPGLQPLPHHRQQIHRYRPETPPSPRLVAATRNWPEMANSVTDCDWMVSLGLVLWRSLCWSSYRTNASPRSGGYREQR